MKLNDANLHAQGVSTALDDNDLILKEYFKSDKSVLGALCHFPRFYPVFRELTEKAHNLVLLSEISKQVLIHQGVLDATGTYLEPRFEETIFEGHRLLMKFKECDTYIKSQFKEAISAGYCLVMKHEDSN
jgi:hypothetical protein